MAARALTVYRVLLRAYPTRYRVRFGEDMTDVFADRLRAAGSQGGFAVTALWLRTIGDVVRHAAAERRRERQSSVASEGFMSGVLADFVSTIRGLVRRPAFALSVSSMLAVGLGFNSALFAVVQSVLLKPLPYANPDRLTMLWTGRNPDGTGGVNSYGDFVTWQQQSHSFSSLATYNISFGTLSDGGDPEEVGGATRVARVLPHVAPTDGTRPRHRGWRRRAAAGRPTDRDRVQPVATSLQQ